MYSTGMIVYSIYSIISTNGIYGKYGTLVYNICTSRTSM